ncbi:MULTISPECIES: glycine zipper 2TM domain-containing protein [Achromobacter]|uniref:Glycine zipper 2TM domain-containing protein n=1 Tax=Achromobacter spanius TaxID=217203 RepID=A0ABY8GPK2_9BURK|nr:MULTISPECIES: glycine zipper 2TM domain-containing protein [Achromobacter]WAI83976.1 glycine zipper 2TM domain-containing protein [Achromobacter spanius]WEX94058.1 glycine zipper 2TM domain-containing protein [Achromobacter sp. SS2-2022]WFP06780.1 glycine zipper 2TM domain-containing protein [Achromobacter spanius]
MNTSTRIQNSRSGLHPLVAAAAIAVIVMCAVGVAAVMGWLPTPSANPHADTPVVEAGPEDANLAPAPGAQPGQQQAQQAQQSAPQTQQARPASASAPRAAAPAPAKQACQSCGVVETIRQVQVPVKDNSDHLVGTIGGGVVGGVVGNQFGGGSGKTALTVLGAVGGALAGREVERNIRQQQTVTHYELTVRMNDGSARQFRSAQPFAFASGDHVRVENNQLLPG